ncbi:MAG: hypothetical protein H8E70_00340 [Candidatus Marinimicrobia bacterium]|nr:hypothetical protein [Candidatus Neomarinimicrobiota bacterium]
MSRIVFYRIMVNHKLIKKIIFHPRQAAFFLLPFSFLLITACPDPPEEIPKRDTSINLEVLSAFTTTARLHISVEDTTAEWTFGLKRNGEDILTATVFNNDTTFVDNALTPSTQYTYQAQWMEDGIALDSSLDAIAITMDTTSHNFVWEIDTLGDSGSYLNDVAIVDENNIWVVGMIKIPDPDSSFNGTGWESFNAAHWDGTEWKYQLIGQPGVIGDGVHYFAENDIWVATGIIYHWNGEEWERFHLYNMGVLGANDGGVTEIWGTSSSNIYFAGRKGSIVHYDGSEFTKMESGTEVDLEDIDGTEDGEHVFATGYEQTGTWAGHSIALALEDGQWVTVRHEDSFTPFGVSDWGLISSVWSGEDEAYFMTYAGLKYYDYTTGETGIKYTMWEMGTSTDHIVNIKGNDVNDIFLIGRLGGYYHFNGIQWYKNNEIENNISVYTTSMDYKDNIYVSVGWEISFEHAYIIRGYRLN